LFGSTLALEPNDEVASFRNTDKIRLKHYPRRLRCCCPKDPVFGATYPVIQ
jgi:hypothetical protein